MEEDNTGLAEMSAGEQNTNMYKLNARTEYQLRRLKKYDVPLYRRGADYVLHRVVKVLPESYVICSMLFISLIIQEAPPLPSEIS